MTAPQLVLGTQYAAGAFNGLMVVGEDRPGLCALLQAAQTAGIEALDTAPLYARTIAETVVGEAGWKGAIWTKVGIDVGRPLPVRDFTEPSMRAGLAASLKRLRRPKADLALLHNPSVDRLTSIDFSALKAEWRDLCDGIGVSLHDAADMRQLAAGPPLDADLLLLELPLERDDWGIAAALGRRYRIALRGIFRQGAWFKAVPAHQLRHRIVERALELIESIRPSYIVVAPRTVDQLQDYRDLSGLLHA